MLGATSVRVGFPRGRRAGAVLAALGMLAAGTVPAAAQDAATTATGSDLRIGVLGVADAIAAMGRTPELAEALPFTRTSVADVLQLDDVVTQDLVAAMAGSSLAAALEEVRGITDVVDEGSGRLSFAYAQTETVDLELAHDDGDLRFGANEGAGDLTVTLATPTDGERFVVEVDADQPDPLLRFALVSEPDLELTVDVDTADVADFTARQGFTEIEMTDGRYQVHREAAIRLRDPNGRGLLTLEDLRYSNLVDLYEVTRDLAVDEVAIAFDVTLPGGIGVSGASDQAASRTGRLVLDGPPTGEGVWPDAADASQAYGDALEALTGLSLVDGVTGLAEYTGTALVLQDAADVNFPNLGGSVTDLFAPADDLLDLLATSAVAEIRCGLTPENPPPGNAAPGDTVYCDAVTASGLPAVTSAAWSAADGGTVAAVDPTDLTAVGDRPTGTVRIDDSDGQPDVVLVLTFEDGSTMTARSLPRTIQDVTSRITELGDASHREGSSDATVNLDADRLDVAVDLTATSATADLPVGDPSTLGALVGLTGLSSGGDAATATATATGASFDVGFGIPMGEPADAADVPSIDLLPADATMLEVDALSADTPTGLTGLTGRIGFLGVEVDVTELALGDTDSAPVVSLAAENGTDAIPLDDLLSDQGTVAADQVSLASGLTASIAFTAQEEAMPGGGYATGAGGPASGGATVRWGASGLPRAEFTPGYADLRVFDPVPASFLTGTATVTPGTETVDDFTDPGNPTTTEVDLDTVTVTVDGGDLFTRLRAPEEDGVEVARRLVGEGVNCQNVTVVDAGTLTCEGLAPDGSAAFENGDVADLIVLGDPFALRDGIIDGLAGSLNEFDRLDSDNTDLDDPDDRPDDQYASTLPLVDLTPSQLAVEREDIAAGLAGIVDAATADEVGGKLEAGDLPVSSAQELSTFVEGEFGAGSLAFDVQADDLGVTLTADAEAGASLPAPLRFTDDTVGQVVSQFDVTVQVSSSTTIATRVDVATARPSGSDRATSTSTATLDAPVTGLLQAGIAELTADTGSNASLDVTVVTSWDATERLLTTAERTGDGARADIVVADRDDLDHEAEPWESSGGTGAIPSPPDPMQVTFLAEGLDGLAAALDGGLDGASPRVTGPEGAPVAAPLIGSDLDAGAEIADSLTALTSLLRDQLELVDAATAAELETDVEDAVTAALDVDSDEISGSGTTATVECDDCTPPCDEDDEPAGCGVDGPTAWDRVSVTTTLRGETRTGETEFAIGLDGINVHSDQPVDTETSWTLPITLELVRGVGPQVTVDTDDSLELAIAAELPAADDVSDALGSSATADTCDADVHTHCIPAIIGYLPGMLTTTSEAAGSVDTTVSVALAEGSHDLFELHDGVDTTTGFLGDDTTDVAEVEGLALDFETVASEYGSFDLTGTVNVPWTAQGGVFTDPDVEPATSGPVDGGFQKVSYTEVKLDVGEVIAMLATPFDVVDPYLGPARDVIDVLRTPIPVVSDISELAGGGSISLLSIVESFGGSNPKLDLAIRVSGFLEAAVEVVGAVAAYAQEEVPLEDLAAGGALLTVPPSEVELASSCTQTVRTSTGNPDGTRTGKKSAAPCPEPGAQAGARKQTTDENRRGTRNTKTSVAKTTKSITGSAPGFSIPFLADPDQLVDVLTGEGEATYFRLDFGTLQAEVAYSVKFGPIMAGPVPIVPFIGGSIGIEGRMAAGFDSMPQTLAVRSVPKGDIAGLVRALDDFDGGDIIREAFYLDDLDADGVDVPEVKLVTTLEAGAGVSIGIVTAGLKGGVTLTINLDLNDPNGDGRIRTVEIREMFGGDPACLFDVSATLEAFLQIFVEINLLLTTKNFVFDILRLGPYTLFEYGCPDEVPTLVVEEAGSLALTSGIRDGRDPTYTSNRGAPSFRDIPEDYEVRQFDTGGGAAGGGTTTFEIDAINRVQRVTVAPATSGYTVTIYQSGVAVSTTVQTRFTVPTLSALGFLADGNDGKDDTFSFLLGEAFDEGGTLLSTPFTAPVTVHGHGGKDVLATGDGDDTATGGGGDDSITTGLGADVVTAGAGDDIVEAGAGRDDITGGDGNDRLQGGPGPDRVAGGNGDDSLLGGPGRDVRAVLLDGDGYPTPQAQVELGFDSGDVLVGGAGGDAVDGGDGSDIVVGGGASSLTGASMAALFATVAGGRTVNVIDEGTRAIGPQDVDIDTAVVPGPAALDGLCASGTPTTGAAGGDLVTGGPEADVVIGGNGTDDLDGGGDDDEICGRAGDDNIAGDGGVPPTEAGDDVIRGGHGNDLVDAGPGDDVAYGDDLTLFRGGVRVLDGSLGTSSSGAGDDYITGADGDDVLAGGAGSDLLRGGAGDDRAHGEGSDTADAGGAAPSLEDRLVACNPTTRIVGGHVDLDGDLLAGTSMTTGVGGDITPDDGRLAGLEVADGVLLGLGSTDPFTGLIAGETVVVDGLVDLDRDGTIGPADTGTVALASMLGTTAANPDGDCILGEDGDDDLRGGSGSDHVDAGAGLDLIGGGDGNDLLVGGAETDVVVGGPHHDVLVGGDGDDHLVGGDGDDRLRGNDGNDDLLGGTGTAGADDGQDVLLGGRGEDVLAGENAILVAEAVVDAVDGAPWTDEGIVPAAVRAGAGSALRHADSAVTCSPGSAPRWVTLLEGDGEVGTPVASPGGPELYDELYGGFGCDWVFGQEGHDLVRGGQDDDVVEGGPDDDTAHGDAGDDVVIGGSSVDPQAGQVVVGRSGEGVADGDDTLYGDGGPDDEVGDDLIIGDNGTPHFAYVSASALVVLEGAPPPPTVTIVLADVPAAGTTIDPGVFGDDHVEAEGGDDRVFGQSGDDTIHGQAGDDDLQGNAGADTVYGEDGRDRIVGGSAIDQSGPDGVDHVFTDIDDGDDDLAGGAGVDWIAGDNAVISPDGDIALADVRVLDQPLPRSAVAGDDVIHGDRAPDGEDLSTEGGAPDVIRGQSGNDTVHGQVGDDDIEGNAGADTLYGNDGDDDIVGGSRRAGIDDAEVDGDGDWISGGAGTDWIVGDNALLERHAEGTVELLDLPVAGADAQPDAGAAGGDVIHGDGAGDDAGSSGAADVIHGQSGDDQVDGQAGDDVVDGNAGADTILGGDGDDALVGGSSADDGTDGLADGADALVPTAGPGAGRRLLAGLADDLGDTISGGPGVDVVLGDNGVVDGHGIPATWRLHDVDVAGAGDHAHAGVAGPDALSGDAGTDVLVGQGGDDRLSGGDADDSLHGGPGADIVQGDAGADDLVGGSSHHWVEARLVELRTVVDGADLLFGSAPTGDCLAGLPATADCDEASTDPGGDLGDTITGDNGHVTRDSGADARLVAPTTDDNTGDPVRTILLYDVDVIGGATFPAAASGADTVFAAAGRDRVFGQAGPDRLHGQAGDDEIEGNGGDDVVVGAEGSDDLLGGSSSDVHGLVQAGPFPDGGTDVADGDDELLAGPGHDVALGDNGIVLRPVGAGAANAWQYHAAPYEHVRRSTVEVAFAFEQAGAFGDDVIDAGAGHDDARGQLGDDQVHGRDGDDTLIGDLGRLREHATVASGDPRTTSVTIPADALDEPVFRTGSLYREVELFETVGDDPEVSTSQGTGDDLLTGGAGNDVLHGGSGDDVVNGHGDIEDDGTLGAGPDVDAVEGLDEACGNDPTRLACDEDEVFAGHGDDQVWGGPGHDRLFGGHNDDDLDVIRTAPAEEPMFRNPDVDYVGVDLVFGGWGQDALQADRSDNGPDQGDRLIDSAGAYNAFFVCDGGLGDSTVIRRLSPATITFLESVGVAAGAYLAASTGESGWWSLATIYNQDARYNNSPTHPEHPGNFVCFEPAEDPEPVAPTAAFSRTCTDLACTFTDETTSDVAVTDWEWAWDFGDGTTSAVQDPTHEFGAPGAYDVELTVTADGQAATIVEQVEVGLVLEAVGSKEKGRLVVDLSWNDDAMVVDVLRDESRVAGAVSGGTHRDEVGSKGSYTYRVCDAAAPTVCSADVTVTF